MSNKKELNEIRKALTMLIDDANIETEGQVLKLANKYTDMQMRKTRLQNAKRALTNNNYQDVWSPINQQATTSFAAPNQTTLQQHVSSPQSTNYLPSNSVYALLQSNMYGATPGGPQQHGATPYGPQQQGNLYGVTPGGPQNPSISRDAPTAGAHMQTPFQPPNPSTIQQHNSSAQVILFFHFVFC